MNNLILSTAMDRKVISVVIAVLVLAVLSVEARGAYLRVGKPAPPFSVSSGSDEKLTLGMLRGKIIVLFYESRQVIRKNLDLKNELKKLYSAQPDRIKNDIFPLVVIDCSEAFWATLPIWKSKLNEHSRKEGFTIYGDWTRRMLADYRLQGNESNFLIIDKDGILRYSASGRIGQSQFDKVKELLFALVREK